MRQSPALPISRDQVERAVGPSPWDLTNEVLYKLCRKYPTHTDERIILAKINIIGRVYAAAIERRKYVEPGVGGDKFYITRVLPEILGSKLDEWIAEAKGVNPQSDAALPVLLDVHKRTTDLFNSISGQNKRSLASKYLHFHVPELFYIFDTRAEAAVRKLRGFIGKAIRPGASGDPTYEHFAAKCALLKSRCETEFGIRLSPRKLDNLLLAIVS